MSLVLTQIQAPPGRISLAGVVPDRLAALSVGQIERLPLAWGRERPALGDFFRVAGTPGETLRIVGADRRFAAIGGGMAGGQCTVEGDAGDFVGQAMQGGVLRVEGGVGRFAACELAGGELHVAGDAGEGLGASMPWSGAGMRGGRVLVRGSAGARCGDRMRRGEIFIAGAAGDFCAARMVAGSIVVGGGVGRHLGHGMRRGSLFLLQAAYEPAPSFVPTVMCADAYLGLVWRDWAARFAADDTFGRFARAALPARPSARRWMGDLASDGRGEVFAFAG